MGEKYIAFLHVKKASPVPLAAANTGGECLIFAVAAVRKKYPGNHGPLIGAIVYGTIREMELSLGKKTVEDGLYTINKEVV